MSTSSKHFSAASVIITNIRAKGISGRFEWSVWEEGWRTNRNNMKETWKVIDLPISCELKAVSSITTYIKETIACIFKVKCPLEICQVKPSIEYKNLKPLPQTKQSVYRLRTENRSSILRKLLFYVGGLISFHSTVIFFIRHIWIKPVLCSRMVSLFHHTSP